jgi:uncharacterized protein YbjT (DUF2867 family)
VVVTGGTGVLGRPVVAELVRRGAAVRVLSRRPVSVSDAEVARGDLVTGEGLADAVRGADVIVHCASDPRRWHDDVAATDRLLTEARVAGRPHVVFVSIVGVDRIPLPYYQAKLAAEALVRDSGLPWTLLRATQFHELVLWALAALAKAPLLALPRGVAVQPVDAGEVAGRLAELAMGEPAGRVPDSGGPEVLSAADAAHAFLRAAGLRRPLVRVPLPGRTMHAFSEGWNLVRDGQTGSIRFTEFLAERVRPGAPVRVTSYYGRRPGDLARPPIG